MPGWRNCAIVPSFAKMSAFVARVVSTVHKEVHAGATWGLRAVSCVYRRSLHQGAEVLLQRNAAPRILLGRRSGRSLGGRSSVPKLTLGALEVEALRDVSLERADPCPHCERLTESFGYLALRRGRLLRPGPIAHWLPRRPMRICGFRIGRSSCAGSPLELGSPSGAG